MTSLLFADHCPLLMQNPESGQQWTLTPHDVLVWACKSRRLQFDTDIPLPTPLALCTADGWSLVHGVRVVWLAPGLYRKLSVVTSLGAVDVAVDLAHQGSLMNDTRFLVNTISEVHNWMRFAKPTAGEDSAAAAAAALDMSTALGVFYACGHIQPTGGPGGLPTVTVELYDAERTNQYLDSLVAFMLPANRATTKSSALALVAHQFAQAFYGVNDMQKLPLCVSSGRRIPRSIVRGSQREHLAFMQGVMKYSLFPVTGVMADRNGKLPSPIQMAEFLFVHKSATGSKIVLDIEEQSHNPQPGWTYRANCPCYGFKFF